MKPLYLALLLLNYLNCIHLKEISESSEERKIENEFGGDIEQYIHSLDDQNDLDIEKELAEEMNDDRGGFFPRNDSYEDLSEIGFNEEVKLHHRKVATTTWNDNNGMFPREDPNDNFDIDSSVEIETEDNLNGFIPRVDGGEEYTFYSVKKKNNVNTEDADSPEYMYYKHINLTIDGVDFDTHIYEFEPTEETTEAMKDVTTEVTTESTSKTVEEDSAKQFTDAPSISESSSKKSSEESDEESEEFLSSSDSSHETISESESNSKPSSEKRKVIYDWSSDTSYEDTEKTPNHYDRIYFKDYE